MKVAILTDTHAGVRGDAVSFADHQDEFTKSSSFLIAKNMESRLFYMAAISSIDVNL